MPPSSWLNYASSFTEGSASPARRWQTTPFPGDTEAQLTIRQLTEALALPGLAIDYHFLLQGSCEVLWRCREREPASLPALEYFALFDVRLLELIPEILLSGVQDPMYLRVETCGRLVYLYEREGYLQEAIAIAERALRLHQEGMSTQFDRLRKRWALVEAEDA